MRQRSRNSSVARPPPMSSASTGPSSLVADEQRGGAVAAGGLVGPAGQPGAEVGAHDEVGAPAAERGAQRADAERTEPLASKAPTSGSRRSAAWMAVALVLST